MFICVTLFIMLCCPSKHIFRLLLLKGWRCARILLDFSTATHIQTERYTQKQKICIKRLIAYILLYKLNSRSFDTKFYTNILMLQTGLFEKRLEVQIIDRQKKFHSFKIGVATINQITKLFFSKMYSSFQKLVLWYEENFL